MVSRSARWPYLVAIVAIVVGVVTLVMFVSLRSQRASAADFSLTDQTGHAFRLSAQRGHAAIVLFGYTHCPDACPLTLSRLERALQRTRLDDDPRVIFITVDPKRDTPAALAAYLALFDRRFIGLTGTHEQIARIEAAYHTWSQPLPPSHDGDYAVAHGSTTYFIDRFGALRGTGSWDDPSEIVTRNLRTFFT